MSETQTINKSLDSTSTKKVVEYRLTTFDNPWDPFDNFDEWFLFDVGKGYNTCGKIARLSKNRDDYTPREEMIALENTIDRIIELDFFNIYKKVARKETTNNI